MTLDGAQGGAIDESRMVEVGAHQSVRVGVEALLEVEGEDVGVALGGVVQAEAGAVEELAGGLKQQSIFAEPVQQVQIAQAPGAFFEVGLEVIDGVLKLVVPGGGEAADMAIKHVAFGFEELGQTLLQAAPQGFGAGKKAAVEQADGAFNVELVEADALFDGAEALA